jgi:hypothetical protein
MVTTTHPWLLVGPWYRWQDPYDPRTGRASRPVFQKYDTSDFANEFLKDPQHSLKFIDPDDVMQRPVKIAGNSWKLQSAATRKIYLDTHKRFYLVVCELHCDVAGFPSVNRAETCDTGFVVRRRVPRIPANAKAETVASLQELAFSRARLTELDALPPGMKSGASLGIRATLEARYVKAQSDLRLSAVESGISIGLEGWIPLQAQGVGTWEKVEEAPGKIDEQIWPLFPLIPDPRVKNHSSGGRTLWFGVVPTSSSDVDPAGNSKFDDRSLYEIRCFVRRHDPRCPKRRERNHCHGEFVWSPRTESYQLASPMDLQGTSNRPVNIVLPDLRSLQAQTARLKPGQGAPVRMISPPGSAIEPSGQGGGQNAGGPSICSFSIPLITIVATFVFRLFLPVVTLAFGLWFLLRLKFCILPAVSLDAGVAKELDLALGKIDAGIDINVAVTGQLKTDFNTFISNPTSLVSSLSREEAFRTFASQATDFSGSLPEGSGISTGKSPHTLPEPGGTLEYEAFVEVKA